MHQVEGLAIAPGAHVVARQGHAHHHRDAAFNAGSLPETAPNQWRMILKSRGKRLGGEHVRAQRRVLRSTEISTLLAWLPNMHELVHDTLQMYLWTCARGGQILAMRAEHMVEEATGWWWTVPVRLTKTRAMTTP